MANCSNGAHLQQQWTLPGNRHSFPKRPSGSRWSRRILSNIFLPFLYLHLDHLDELSYGGNIEKNHLHMSASHLPQQVTTQQRLSLWRSCHGKLQGISSRLDHVHHSMLLSNKHGVFFSPSHDLFISLLFHLYIFSMSLLMIWLSGQWVLTGIILPTPPES